MCKFGNNNKISNSIQLLLLFFTCSTITSPIFANYNTCVEDRKSCYSKYNPFLGGFGGLSVKEARGFWIGTCSVPCFADLDDKTPCLDDESFKKCLAGRNDCIVTANNATQASQCDNNSPCKKCPNVKFMSDEKCRLARKECYQKAWDAVDTATDARSVVEKVGGAFLGGYQKFHSRPGWLKCSETMTCFRLPTDKGPCLNESEYTKCLAARKDCLNTANNVTDADQCDHNQPCKKCLPVQ